MTHLISLKLRNNKLFDKRARRSLICWLTRQHVSHYERFGSLHSGPGWIAWAEVKWTGRAGRGIHLYVSHTEIGSAVQITDVMPPPRRGTAPRAAFRSPNVKSRGIPAGRGGEGNACQREYQGNTRPAALQSSASIGHGPAFHAGRANGILMESPSRCLQLLAALKV